MATRQEESRSSTSQVSISSAGMRALIYQLQAVYLRTPVKLFRPSRFDYLAYVRELAHKHDNLDAKPYRFRTHSSLGMLFNVLRKEGWQIVPDKVLPPLIANSATGVILYSTYLTTLNYYTNERARRLKEAKQKPKSEEELYWSAYRDKIEIDDPSKISTVPVPASTKETKKSMTPREKTQAFLENHPLFADTFRAGFIAGAFQSLVAAPIDAIYTRSTAADLTNGTHTNLWAYGASKLREIGLIGVFAGYGFSFVKESVGFAFYFSTFEFIKTQGYQLTYKMISSFRNFRQRYQLKASETPVNPKEVQKEQAKSTRLLKSSFVLLAGASAAVALLAVQYPLNKVHKVHLSRLEVLDVYNANKVGRFPRLYYNSYVETFYQCLKYKKKSQLGWFRFAYHGFVRNALTTIPATSVGLLVFEMMRTKMTDIIEDEPLAY